MHVLLRGNEVFGVCSDAKRVDEFCTKYGLAAVDVHDICLSTPEIIVTYCVNLVKGTKHVVSRMVGWRKSSEKLKEGDLLLKANAENYYTTDLASVDGVCLVEQLGGKYLVTFGVNHEV